MENETLHHAPSCVVLTDEPTHALPAHTNASNPTFSHASPGNNSLTPNRGWPVTLTVVLYNHTEQEAS